ncbi:hypothetical protein GCM10010275_00120 [Streptomyces litmocidini]|uniref:hypothetical protein n=1 Tax=Streptomyces litmocidini TaxID=67318 RepID=UPI00167DD34A|nr:hypothetical protein [Streptomyces litmocidini]GGU70214.1 hypothetical protein GCM10010275_00120 [Streptomyces litmocidini]
MPVMRHEGGDYAITILYSVPDDAWYLELGRVADRRTLLTAVVPDEDPERGPTVCVDPVSGHHPVPYEVVRWFMEHVDREIAASRGWTTLRPDLVRTVRRLREMDRDGVFEGDLPALSALLAEELSAEDLALVTDGAFGAQGFAEAAAGEPGPDRIRELRARRDAWVRDTGTGPIG